LTRTQKESASKASMNSQGKKRFVMVRFSDSFSDAVGAGSRLGSARRASA
jgi:hypothetical protein